MTLGQACRNGCQTSCGCDDYKESNQMRDRLMGIFSRKPSWQQQSENEITDLMKTLQVANEVICRIAARVELPDSKSSKEIAREYLKSISEETL